jgi:hypothetical protein
MNQPMNSLALLLEQWRHEHNARKPLWPEYNMLEPRQAELAPPPSLERKLKGDGHE